MKDKVESISMPKYGVTDIVNRITYIPTRRPDETPEEAFVRGKAQVDHALSELVRALARKLVQDIVSGRIKLDDVGNFLDEPQWDILEAKPAKARLRKRAAEKG